MAINSISTLAQVTQLQTSNASISTRLTALQEQISSGYVSETYAGLGANAKVSINLRAESAQLSTFSSVNATVSTELSAQASGLTNIASLASSFSDEIIKVQNDPNHSMATLQSLAQSTIAQIDNTLNIQVNGRYIYAGVTTDTKPMSDPSTILANVATQLSGYTDATATTVASNTTAYMNANLSQSYAADQSSNMPTAQIDQNLTVQYGARADNPAIQQVLQSLYTVAGLNYDSTNETGFNTLLAGAASTLSSGLTGLNNLSAKVGNQQALLQTTATQQSDTETTLTTQLSNIEDIDVASATTELNALQTQLQASYKVTAALQQLSLVTYI